MLSPHEERRPARSEAANPGRPPVNKNGSILRADSPPLLAVLVVRELVNGGTRRTVVRSLSTAEKHVARAHAVGCAAELRLVQLVPMELTPAAVSSLEDGGCE